MVPIKILIGYEESQTVMKAFRSRGHEAYSCDLQDCSGDYPEYHLKMDVRGAIKLNQWDIFICHPECKYLCWSGERWLKNNPVRQSLREEAFVFIKEMYEAPIPKVCIENSLSFFLERNWKKPTQKIHPYHFGSPFVKTTALWIRGLSPLLPDNIVTSRNHAVHRLYHKDKYIRSKLRAKTDPNIARAMSEQWSPDLGFFNTTVSL